MRKPRSPALDRRARRSAIVARLTLTIFREMTRDFGHNDLAECVPDLLISMAIRVNDEDGHAPIALKQLERFTGISRRTVGRRINSLAKRGAFIFEEDVGVYGNDAYLEARMEADFFINIMLAIAEAEEALKKIDAEELAELEEKALVKK
jgi:hypothetical protein